MHPPAGPSADFTKGGNKARPVHVIAHDILAPIAPVRVMEPPYEAVSLQEALWWHPVHTHDAAHIWLRETAARVGAGLPRSQDGTAANGTA